MSLISVTNMSKSLPSQVLDHEVGEKVALLESTFKTKRYFKPQKVEKFVRDALITKWPSHFSTRKGRRIH